MHKVYEIMRAGSHLALRRSVFRLVDENCEYV